MANPVNWFHISVKEVEPTAKFYGEAFDWKLEPGPGGMVFIDTGKGGIPGGIATSQDGKDFPIHVYVGTDSIDEQLARIEKAGGKTFMPKMELPEGMGWIAGFTDPAGNFVGLWEQVPQPKAAKAPKRAAAKAAKAEKKAAKGAKKAEKKAAKGAKKAAKRAKKAAKKG